MESGLSLGCPLHNRHPRRRHLIHNCADCAAERSHKRRSCQKGLPPRPPTERIAELLELDLELEIARQTTDSFTQTPTLFTHRLEGGVASKLDTSRAAAALAAAAASIPELERQIALKENQISILLGNNPSLIPHKAKFLDQVVPPHIPAGLPSALFIWTCQFALSSLSSGQTNVWSVAGNLAGPIYPGGALKAQKRQNVAFWEQTKLQYEQTAQAAFQDVSNALISRQKYEAIRDEQAQAVQGYQESVQVSLQRYTAGKASYFEVLDAQL